MERPGVMRGTISGADVCEGDTHFRSILPAGRTMPRDGAIIFGDLVGKLDVLHVACDKCGAP